MAQIKVPMTNVAFYKNHEAPQVKKQLNLIKATYGTFISNASRLCNVPEEVIIAFIFIESAGKPHVISHAGAIGLMQLKPESANDIIHLEKKTGNLTADEKALIRKFIGN